MGHLIHEFQIADLFTGENIETTGGQALVCTQGSPDLATIYDPDNDFAAIAGAKVDAARGRFRFATLDTVRSVDLYGFAPGGQAFTRSGLKAKQSPEVWVETNRSDQTLVVPFSIADSTANVFKDTLLDIPANWLFQPFGNGVKVTALDATETISVGFINAGESGDEDGLIAGLSVATAITHLSQAAVTAGTETYFSSCTIGAYLVDFLAGANTATDVGTFNPKVYRTDGTIKSLGYTLSTGSDTAKGYIFLNYKLPSFGA